MIKSKDLFNLIKIILEKDEIVEEDLEKVEDLTLNKYELDGTETDIDLDELVMIKNLKTLTLIKFTIKEENITKINNIKLLNTVQFTNCKFESINPLKQEIDNIVIDNCDNVKLKIINNNKLIKIIGSSIDMKQINQSSNIQYLYLQNCEIRNIIELLKYDNLKFLSVDGSITDNQDFLNIISQKINVSYEKEYHPTD